jgi:formylglycine-generating enzyme required for sulfatase activity
VQPQLSTAAVVGAASPVAVLSAIMLLGGHEAAAGNVEGTADWYGAARRRAGTTSQPQFAIARKVLEGGSFLCADSHCLRYRPAARRPQMIDPGMSHVGFRLVRPG